MGEQANDLAEYGHLLVRRAILRDDWVTEAIFDLAANGRTEWTLVEWDAVVAKIEESTLTVAEWSVYYT